MEASKQSQNLTCKSRKCLRPLMGMSAYGNVKIQGLYGN